MHKLFEQVILYVPNTIKSSFVSYISVFHVVVVFQVLERKDLSKAGDLFSLEDSVIVDELSAVIKALQVTVFFWCSGY